MLPVYTTSSDAVHFRHPTTSTTPQSVRAVFHARPSRKRAARVVLQLLGAAVLLMAVWGLYSMSVRMQGSQLSAGGGSTHIRRMLDGDKSLIPAASLRNLVSPKDGSMVLSGVLVAGHAVYVGNDYAHAANESVWFLEEYQKVPGEAQSFLDHIEVGINEAAKDPNALLLFSGGQTRLAAGPRSEGLSYWVVAEAAGWFGQHAVRNRTFTEEHARDSFENLLFGLCRFFELTGHYPELVTVVSYTLKRDRFYNLHRKALRFPIDRFHFLGTEVPPEAKGAEAGEQRTVEAFQKDLYGCTGDLLQKRLRRDPFAVGPPHHSRCPALRGLLAHCSPGLYQGDLPWDNDRRKTDVTQEMIKWSFGQM